MRLPRLIIFALSIFLLALPAATQDSSQPASSHQESQQKGMMMLTIVLKHDQSKTLDQIQQHLKETGFDKSFPA
jgi:maltose-binding protein MalE